jgi:hypothetical protein
LYLAEPRDKPLCLLYCFSLWFLCFTSTPLQLLDSIALTLNLVFVAISLKFLQDHLFTPPLGALTFDASYVLTNKSGNVVAKYVGGKHKGFKTSIWVPKVLVSNVKGPKTV